MRRISRRQLLVGAAGAAAAGYGLSRVLERGPASPPCPPGANDIVRENLCTPRRTWTDAFADSSGDARLSAVASPQRAAAGQPVEVRLSAADADSAGDTTATIGVLRLGHYGDRGSRLVHVVSGVALARRPEPETDRFGWASAASWPVSAVIPASATRVTGTYVVKVASSDGKQALTTFAVGVAAERTEATPSA